jgi:hypothetical protein
MGTTYSPDIVTNGLVLCLDAADKNSYPGSGTTWADLSTGENNSTLTNSPTYSAAPPKFFFDESNDYVQLPNLQLVFPFTISFWGKQSEGEVTGPHITFSDPTENKESVGLGLNLGSGHMRIYYYTGTTFHKEMVYDEGDNDYPYEQIYHITGTYTSSDFKLYVDGIYKGTLSMSFSKNWTDTSSSYNIMRLNRPSLAYYGGYVYQASVYNRALTDAEVFHNFEAHRGRFGI